MGEIKMVGQRGIFLTFMVFLLIGAALALNVVIKQTAVREERGLIEESSLREVNEAFDNLYSQAVVSREGFAGEVQSRLLPLSEYKYGDNWFMAKQKIPVREDSMRDMYDAFNLFEIFVEEQNTNPGLEISADSLKNQDWDSGAKKYPEIGYLVLPQCVKYTIGHDTANEKSRNIMLIETGPTGSCSYDADNVKIHYVDVNVTLGSCDFPKKERRITCHGGFDAGRGGCLNVEYDGSSSGYAIIDLNFTDCADGKHKVCEEEFGEAGTKTIKGYLSSGEKNEIYLNIKGMRGSHSCQQELHIELYKTTAHVDDDPIFMTYRGSNYWTGNQEKKYPIVDVSDTIIFTNNIKSVELDAMEISVKREDFGYCRRSRGGSCS